MDVILLRWCFISVMSTTCILHMQWYAGSPQWGWKSTVPKDIWFLLTFELLLAGSKKSRWIHDSNAQAPHGRCQLTRVNSANVLDEGLRIGGRGRRMNSKIKISQTRRGFMCVENKRGTQLTQSPYVPGRPLMAPIYRWPGLEKPVGFNINYNVCIWCHLVFQLHRPRGTKIMGLINYILVTRSDTMLEDELGVQKRSSYHINVY
jgi:hypothetical protein